MTGRLRSIGGGVSLDPTGLLALNGDFFHVAGGVLKIDLGGSDNSDPLDLQYDVLAVDGTATLEGSLQVDLVVEEESQFALELGQQFTVLTAAGGIVGQFSNIIPPALPQGFDWQIHYGANDVTLEVVAAALPGDYNSDGVVNVADYTLWRDLLGAVGVALAADGDGNRSIGIEDYQIWKTNFGQTLLEPSASSSQLLPLPEPASCILSAAIGLVVPTRDSFALNPERYRCGTRTQSIGHLLLRPRWSFLHQPASRLLWMLDRPTAC